MRQEHTSRQAIETGVMGRSFAGAGMHARISGTLVVLAVGCAGPGGAARAEDTAPPRQVQVAPGPICRAVKIPPTPRLERRMPGSERTLTEDQLSMVHALSERVFRGVAMFGLQPLAVRPRPANGRMLRLWADPANGWAERMVELDSTSGREEVRAYAWFGEGDESIRGECGEIVCATVQEGNCGAIACLDEQPGEVYRGTGQLRGCDVRAPDCLPGLVQAVAPPRGPTPANKRWTHGYSLWVEYLDHEQYWIGEYEDYFPKPRMDAAAFIQLLSGRAECPGASAT